MTIPGPVTIEGETRWEGKVVITGVATVPAGSRLQVAPGAEVLFAGEVSGLTVLGSMDAEGTPEAPVILGPEAEGGTWRGLEILDGGEGRFRGVVARGAKRAFLVNGSSARLEASRIETAETGIESGMESSVEIVDCRFREAGVGIMGRLRARITVRESVFENCGRFGVVLDTAAGGRITGCRFEGGSGVLLKQAADVFLGDNEFIGCETGVVADQVKHDARLSGNRFDAGKIGVVCVDFATPWIACCTFSGLETGVLIRRFSNPMIMNCRFEKNKRGLHAREKADFPVKENVFRDNEEAVFLDMSAYPRINGNDFTGNGKDIVLGIYMSADWEKRVGSGNLSRQEAQRQGTHNPGGVAAQREYSGVVDAKGNWWGEKTTAEMAEKGPDGDIAVIHDVHDTPEVSYPDFGEGSFRLDRVEYSPWAEAAVEGAGPLPAGCGDLK